MKTALAPTAELATPKVEQFINTKLLPQFGSEAKVEQFFICDPSTSDVFNHEGEKWVEGNWGAYIICNSFSSGDLYEFSRLSKTISVNEATVHAAGDHKVQVRCWLSARVMR